MKLAEALQERADLNRTIQQLKERLDNNVLVQEGEQPAEQPERLKQELQKKIAETEFDIKQIDTEIQNAKRDNALPEQLEVLMEEKKELQNSLYQLKRDLRSGNYTNSL